MAKYSETEKKQRRLIRAIIYGVLIAGFVLAIGAGWQDAAYTPLMCLQFALGIFAGLFYEIHRDLLDGRDP